MRIRRIESASALGLAFFAACAAAPRGGGAGFESTVITADIQEGIEAHISNEVEKGKGYYHLKYENKFLKLKLVKVHTEYLANLGPESHFACVDLADVTGDVYDVDFFLEGARGAMRVTETTVHKFNGQPYYAWDQHEDGTWHRIAIEDARDEHLGVVKGIDEFEFIYKVSLPEMEEPARMWLPQPSSDEFQTVRVLSVNAPRKGKVLRDARHGNDVIMFELTPEDSGGTVTMRFDVRRREKKAYAEPDIDRLAYLSPEQLVPDSDDLRKISAEVLAGKTGELVRARALYDYVIDRMKYAKSGEGWGKGDAVYACDIGSGNCTDFHSLFIALSRAGGIPARFAIGASIPSSRNDGALSGYHCWAEFHAEGKWWPVDISEADKYSSLATYYFGHHPANRFEFSRGRDLVLDPGPKSGPINFLAYPVLEIGGRSARAKVRFFFERKTADGVARQD